jgi:aryl-alcohol dehydrogenase-like predicted oxidoreductase
MSDLYLYATSYWQNQVDIFYLHTPDRRVPLEDLLAGINALY